MNSSELKKAKRDLRRLVIAQRDELPVRERDREAIAITERFLALEELAAARTVMGFWSFGSEVPTGPLLEALVRDGCRVALPQIVDGELRVRVWAPGDRTTSTRFGAREPAGGDPLGSEEVDLVITPGVAFDRTGRRVGYGGGFYDRFLATTREDAPAVGIGFDLQLRDNPLPCGDFDLRVDLVVTASQTVRCPTRR